MINMICNVFNYLQDMRGYDGQLSDCWLLIIWGDTRLYYLMYKGIVLKEVWVRTNGIECRAAAGNR